jgi:hypothetical protein
MMMPCERKRCFDTFVSNSIAREEGRSSKISRYRSAAIIKLQFTSKK